MLKSLGMYYLFHIVKFLSVSYIFYRLGKKFHASNPFWHYMIPVFNYIILCRCTNTPKSYAIGYYVFFALASAVKIAGDVLHDPALANIWVSMFAMCIYLEAEIFSKMALRLRKKWLYAFSGFVGYFPLIFLILSKTEPAPALPPPSKGNYPVY